MALPASVYTCKCLNVKIHPRVATGKEIRTVNPRDYGLHEEQLGQKIFQGSTEVAEVQLDVGGVRNEQSLLFSSGVISNWSFFTCLNCKTATHCCRLGCYQGNGNAANPGRPQHTSQVQQLSPTSSSPVSSPVMLINVTHLISDHKKIQQLSQSQDFSPLFRIILPTTWGSPNSSDRWISNRSESFSSPLVSPTSPKSIAPSPGRRVSALPSPSSADVFNPIQQTLATTLHQQLQKYLQDEEATLETRIKKFEEEQRDAFEAKAEKARRDRTYLLNLIQSNSLEQSTAIRSMRARHSSSGSTGSGGDDGPTRGRSRRESAPTAPVTVTAGPSVDYPGVPAAFHPIGSPLSIGSPGLRPLTIGSPVLGGLVEVSGLPPGSSSATSLHPLSLTLPSPNRNVNNNNSSADRDRRAMSPSGLFSMDVDSKRDKVFEEEEEEEEELEEVAPGDCSPFEPIESSDNETDPDDNSLEDLRKHDESSGQSFIPNSSERDRKFSKYSTSAPMNIAAFPQSLANKATVDIPLDEIGAFEEESPSEAQPADPDQIAASMQALAMSHRDEDDPEAIFGERPRRRLNTLELYQLRQFKKPGGIARQTSSTSPGLQDAGFSPGSSGLNRSGR